MEVLYPQCCGLDVHKSSVSACVLIREGTRTHKKYSRFGAMTHDLEELARWLHELGVTHVAMESTGVYWKSDIQPPCARRVPQIGISSDFVSLGVL